MTRLLPHLAAHGVAPELSVVLDTIAVTCKEIASKLELGKMAGILGMAGHTNVQGEDQKALDVISNEMLKQALIACPHTAAVASEEEDYSVPGQASGRYLICFDPLDGSSNIDINAPVGTIFSIYEKAVGVGSDADFLRPGREQVAAGYVMYGPSAMLVLTTGQGVDMFTLDRRIGEYVLTEKGVTLSADTKEFAINMSNQRHWAPPMQRYIGELLAGETGPRGKNFNMRWLAAMVGDVHRILCRGGVFTYPWDQRKPDQAGKLRLMYEGNPMAMLIEQAGGRAYAGTTRILDLQPEKIHQRIPVVLGSANEVEVCVAYHREHDGQ